MIDMQKVSWGEKDKYHKPDNVGAVVTFTLIFQHLHDTYNYGRFKFAEIMNEFEKFLQPPYPKYEQDYNTLLDVGLDRQLYQDYLRRLPKAQEQDDTYSYVLGKQVFTNKKERERYIESAEVTYLLVLKILHEKCKFTKKRINKLQKYLKDAENSIFNKDVKIVEFMECLSQECKQRYGILEDYRKKKKLDMIPIYGEYGKKWMKYD